MKRIKLNRTLGSMMATALLLAVAGCSSSGLDYAPASRDGSAGYSESQIANDRYRVSFTGSRSASHDEVKDYALLRAAEVTLLNDRDWFKVVSSDVRQSQREVPGSSMTVSQPPRVHKDCGLLGCTTTVTPGYSGTVATTTTRSGRTSSSIEIVMGSGEAPDPTTVYNASELREFLTRKYELSAS